MASEGLSPADRTRFPTGCLASLNADVGLLRSAGVGYRSFARTYYAYIAREDTRVDHTLILQLE